MMRSLAIIALLTATALAQPDTTVLNYRVQRGDSLDVLAAELYGDKDDAIFIIAENKLKRARPLNPGERLRIPVTREIRTEKGDNFESLAQRYLGDAKRAPFLAEFNHRSVEESLATGTELTIPFHVTHTAQGTETLAQISTTYFGNPKHADELAKYNAMDRTSIDKGEQLDVPILNVRVRDAKLPPLDAESQARDKQRRDAAALAQTALPAAHTAWMQGDFARVKEALALLADKTDYLDTDTAIDVDLMLGKAHVAFDDTALAVAAFTRVLARKPRYELSPYHDSPKVIEAWQKAVSQLQGQ
jgi:phage tail protein X